MIGLAGLADRHLEHALEPLLVRWLGRDLRIAAARRSPLACSSSHPLEALDVELADGGTVPLLLKPQRVRSAEASRPAFVDDPEREGEVFREILGPCRVGAPACLGTVQLRPASPSARDRRPEAWLVFERIDGVELFQTDDPGIWEAAARWLARLHARFARRAGTAADTLETLCLERSPRLLRRDAVFHWRWWRRAVEHARFPAGAAGDTTLEDVRRRFERAVERSLSLTPTLIHGEFYPANVLVERTPDGPRIRPVDWEMASVGPGLFDLAALTAGRWTDGERAAMVRAYRDALPAECRLTPEPLEEALDDCRLLLAVQWLGWAADWNPPPEQAHDWWSDVIEITAKDRGTCQFPSAVTP